MTKEKSRLIRELMAYCKELGIKDFRHDDLHFSFKDEMTEDEASHIDPNSILFAAAEGIKRIKKEDGI